MTEKLVPAQNGYTVYAGNTALHSRYNPAGEAEKYIASLEPGKLCRWFILLEPGLGYLEAALQKRFPESRIISLHCSPFYGEEKTLPAIGGSANTGGLCWYPGCGKELEPFLEDLITSTDGAGVKLIEWRPSIKAYGSACLDLAARTVECLRRISANRITIKNFGRRWLRNGLRNLNILRNPVTVRGGSRPLLICAAGPSLEDALDDIGEWNHSPAKPLVMAVSSAVPALLHRKILPDLIIATDGGGWALFHLFESCREIPVDASAAPAAGPAAARSPHAPGGRPVIAAGFTAALPSQMEVWPALILCDGSLWQELLLRTFQLPFVSFPQRGTVSASALDLALYVTTGKVYIAGLDFAHRDLKTHARPYAFERVLEQEASRFRPFYSRSFERERTIDTSGSHGIYAAWFKTYAGSFPGRIYSLGGKTDLGIPHAAAELESGGPVAEAGPCIRVEAGTKAGRSAKAGVSLLLEALDHPGMKKQLSRELGELLLPDSPVEEKDFSGALRNELLELCHG
ncbi:MAG: DUF115 domain-containing protein [Spirochaetaceae bacterium]|jgi:hypothetical protein|nr:DUF115 domain-containing protein [Spirochaetaceae bacterium]